MSKPDVNSKRFLRGKVMCVAALALASLFLIVVQSKVVTYTCGNDPMLYARAARVFLSPSLYGPETLRYYLTFAAPGYSAILAAAITCFGSLSPFWVNLAFMLLTLPLMWIVFRTLMGSDRAAAFSMLGMLLIAFRGHELNAPYLLYPFREAARFFFVYLAYVLLLKGTAKGRVTIPSVLGAGLAVLTAVAVREPSALVLPCIILGAMLLGTTWKSRLKASGWLALPCLLGGVFGCALLLGGQMADLSQFSVMQYLGDHRLGLMNARKMVGWFLTEATWIGLLLMIVGVVRSARRQTVLLALFFLPALLFFVFYSYMQVHYRYFLTSLMFMAVFAGYGLDALCALLEGVPAGNVRSRRLKRVLTWTVMALLAVGLADAAQSRKVWGPEMKAADVKEWQALIEGLEPSEDGRVRVMVEQRCRYLEGVLNAYTDADLVDAREMAQWPDKWAPAHYFKPLNREAHYSTPQWLTGLRIYAHRIASDRANLLPVDGQVPAIGRGEYGQYLLTRWRPGEHVQEFAMPAGQRSVLWLDWGACDAAADRKVAVRDLESGRVISSFTVNGNGLQAAVLSPGDSTRAELVVSSQSAVPSRPLIGVAAAGEHATYSCGVDRMMSLNRLVLELDDANKEEYSLSMELGQRLTFAAPLIHGDDDGVWRVTLAGRSGGLRGLAAVCEKTDGSLEVRDLSTSGGLCTFSAKSGEKVGITLASGLHPAGEFWVIENVSFEYCGDDL